MKPRITYTEDRLAVLAGLSLFGHAMKFRFEKTKVKHLKEGDLFVVGHTEETTFTAQAVAHYVLVRTGEPLSPKDNPETPVTRIHTELENEN